MALPSILTLPLDEWQEWDMRFVDPVFEARTEGRAVERVKIGSQGYWMLEAESRPIGPHETALFQRLDYFVTAVSSGAVFTCPDYTRLRPAAYSAEIVTTGASGQISVLTSAYQITVSGLDAGMVFNQGCLIEVLSSVHVRSLHVVAADATANGSGVVTLTLENALSTTVFSVGNTVQVEAPSCLMQITDYSLPKRLGGRRLSFTAQEVIFS